MIPWKFSALKNSHYTVRINYYTYTCMYVSMRVHKHKHAHTCIATDFVDKAILRDQFCQRTPGLKRTIKVEFLLNKIGVRDSYSYYYYIIIWTVDETPYTWCAKRLVHALLSVYKPYHCY